jgi:prevent-host-death family protein
MEVGVLEAKTRLSELLEAAMRGEDVVITRHGKRMVKLAPVTEPIDVAEEVRLLREHFARTAPNPGAADIDADLNAMRGRD